MNRILGSQQSRKSESGCSGGERGELEKMTAGEIGVHGNIGGVV